MKIAIHQPNYLPWLGYFHKIKNCDALVFLDNVQFNKGAVINRVKIKTSQGLQWLTVPIKTKGNLGQLIKDVEIDNMAHWQRKHPETLRANYGRAENFKETFSELKAVYDRKKWENLCELNIVLIKWIMDRIGLKKELVLASKLKAEGNASGLLINIVKELGGDVYVSGKGGANYQSEGEFNRAGIELEYNNFKHPHYMQLWGGFVPRCSVIDLLFNYGHGSLDIIKMPKGGK